MGARIKDRLAELGWLQRHLLDRVPDLDAGTLSALIKRDSKKSDFSEAIAEALGVNHRWLIEGVGEKLRTTGHASISLMPASLEATGSVRPGDRLTRRARSASNVEPAPDIRPGGIPLISWVQAGNWAEAIDNLAPGDFERLIPTIHPHGPRAFALRVRGDSMVSDGTVRSYHDGDIIFVDPDGAVLHRALVVARLPVDNEVTFKQLLIDGDARYLQALNPQWPNRVVRMPEGAVIVGVVFGSYRDA